MGLAEKLAARASVLGGTAQVDCGELGSVTVEALPVRELELLLRGPDGARKVFYAACRELQAAGEEMRRAEKLYTPDSILQYVSDQEANAAFSQIAALSGVDSGKLSEVRLSSVQEKAGATEEIRPPSVQESTEPKPLSAGGNAENRPETVQVDSEEFDVSGQVSRETGAKFAEFFKVPDSDKKTPSMGEILPEGTQNVVDEENFVEASGKRRSGAATALHEIKSEPAGALHEIKSDFGVAPRIGLHEIESESAGSLHETESDFRDRLHEIESEFRKKQPSALHETESESPEMLHETESELAERTARHFLAGLQRAKWVRGG